MCFHHPFSIRLVVRISSPLVVRVASIEQLTVPPARLSGHEQISKRTGIGGIQGGGAFANGVLYVAGFEGIDDGFSDAQFGSATVTGNYPNAFFATFSPNFWADVEDTAPDGDPSTGMRVKVYALDGATGSSLWNINGNDFVELLAGAALRHVSVANDVVFVTTSSGQLFCPEHLRWLTALHGSKPRPQC